MKRRTLIAVSFSLLAAGLLLADPIVTPNAPITNFKLPVLNEQGIRTSLLRGTEARYVSASQIELSEMQYSTFLDDGSNKVDTTLLAPSATVLIDDNKVRVQGEEGVRLVRSDIDVIGLHWMYDHSQKKITLEKDVRVVFRTELKDILK
jgi:hypothetical protein